MAGASGARSLATGSASDLADRAAGEGGDCRHLCCRDPRLDRDAQGLEPARAPSRSAGAGRARAESLALLANRGRANVPFAPSIAVLTLVQASLIALPARATAADRLAARQPLVGAGPSRLDRRGDRRHRARTRTRRWPHLPRARGGAAAGRARAGHGRPGSEAVARGARIPLFVLAFAVGGLTAQAAALALSALACVALGTLVASLVPPRWLRLAIYAMAAIDTCLVAADLLQNPNQILDSAAPAAGLPQLQFAQFGSAVIGFGDLFIAAVLGALLAGNRPLQLRTAVLVAGLALGVRSPLLLRGGTAHDGPGRRRTCDPRDQGLVFSPRSLSRSSRRCCLNAWIEAASTTITGMA